jgi:hypothetical protein
MTTAIVTIDGETIGERGPMPERTVDDVLSELAMDLKAAAAADLAAAFEEAP